jgi:hypothetical protein
MAAQAASSTNLPCTSRFSPVPVSGSEVLEVEAAPETSMSHTEVWQRSLEQLHYWYL